MKSFFLAVISLSLVVSSQCSNCHWGPSYWCKSETNAAECGSTQFCQENVWKNSRATEKVNAPDSDLGCDMCETLMKYADKELEMNATEDEVKNSFLHFCQSTGPFHGPCQEFVNQYFVQVWQLLVNEMSPSEICKEIKICSNSNEVSRVAKKAELKEVRVQGNVVTCMICEEVAKEIINLVQNNATEAEAEVEVKKVCTYMGGFASECKSLIDDFFPDLWAAAIAAVGDPKALCEKVSMCSSSVSRKAVSLSVGKVSADPLCDICNLVVTFLKPYVDSNETEAKVKQALENLCDLLPSALSDDCAGFVNDYYELVWELLKQEIDSGEVCQMIGFCNGSSVVKSLKVKPRPQSSVGDAACDVCHAAVSFIKPFVDSNTTEAEVKSALTTVCGLLPASVKDECTKYVNDYFDLVWMLLKSEVDSGEICKQIGVCNSTNILMKKVKSGTDTMCSTCKDVVSYVRTLVDSNITETIAKGMVEDFCQKAGALAGECKDLVDQYFPMVWMLIRSYADDEQICTEIKLCSSISLSQKQNAPVEVEVKSPEKVEGLMCVVCEEIMKELISLLDTNATKQDIEDALDKVCSLLPSAITSTCDEFVKDYAAQIIDLILSGAGAKAVCTGLGLCTLKEEVVEETVTIQGVTECAVCKEVLELMKDLIGDKKDDAEKVLDDVCKLVPSGIQTECKMLVDTFGPQLIQLLDDAIDPAAICKEIKLCSASEDKDLLTRTY